MRNKKGILFLLSLSLLCGCFTGCKKNNDDSKKAEETTQTTVVSSTFLDATMNSTETTLISTHSPLYPEGANTMPTYTTRSDESSAHVEYSRNAMQPTTIDGIAGYYAPVVEIPVDCTKINDNAFENNPTVQTLSFQNPYTEIGSYAFSNCSSLRDVTFPEKLQTISDSAFQDCTGIKELEIPESVESIGNTAFYGCTGMYKLTLHEGLKSIGDTAFYGCSSLINVVIPDGVTEIGDYAFGNCKSLLNITIPESVVKCGLYPASGSADVPVEQQQTIQVFVKEGSWIDQNFDMVFQGIKCLKVYQCGEENCLIFGEETQKTMRYINIRILSPLRKRRTF